MSRRRRERRGGPMSAAGLMRFYEEVDVGIRLSPYIVVIIGICMAVVVALLRALIPPS